MVEEKQNLRTRKIQVVMLLSNAYNPDDRVRNEAVSLDRSKYKVTILAWDRFLDKPRHEERDGISIQRIRLKAGYGQGPVKFLIYLWISLLYLIKIFKLKPDIVHCHDFDTYLVGLIYVRLHKAVKLIFDAHENYYMMMKPLVPKPISNWIASLESRYTKYADFVIASCASNADHYRERGAQNTVVIGNWKDPDLYQISMDKKEQKRLEIGADGHMVVTYIGSLTPDRNVIPLIEAIRERPWAFVIVGGTGGEEAEIRQLCEKMPNAYFPGYIHPDDVPLFTATSDVIFYGLDSNDLYAPYNAPNKLFEALAAGKPILASDLGGELSGIVRTEGCGVLISQITSRSIGEALDHIKDPGTRIAMEDRSRKAGKEVYNWKIASRKLTRLYEALEKDPLGH